MPADEGDERLAKIELGQLNPEHEKEKTPTGAQTLRPDKD
jgi:hypothetical protein